MIIDRRFQYRVAEHNNGPYQMDDERIVDVLDNVHAEIARAVAKHTWKRTPLNPDMDHGTALAIITEELGEVARAQTYDEGNEQNYVEELIQLAAMAIARVVGVEGHVK